MVESSKNKPLIIIKEKNDWLSFTPNGAANISGVDELSRKDFNCENFLKVPEPLIKKKSSRIMS